VGGRKLQHLAVFPAVFPAALLGRTTARLEGMEPYAKDSNLESAFLIGLVIGLNGKSV